MQLSADIYHLDIIPNLVGGTGDSLARASPAMAAARAWPLVFAEFCAGHATLYVRRYESSCGGAGDCPTRVRLSSPTCSRTSGRRTTPGHPGSMLVVIADIGDPRCAPFSIAGTQNGSRGGRFAMLEL